MANWCMNWVSVEGEEANVSSLMDEVNALQKEYETKGFGVRPSDEGNLQYMFELYVNDSDSFSFESKWSPSNDSLQFLAKKHRVTLENSYYEPGTMLYGKWTSDGETEKDISLDRKDWDSVTAGDEEESYFIYNGEEYECEEDALDLILQKKLK